jgi:hypothetical protein
MAALDLRPLSLGELLDRTFFLYRRHFLLFIGIAAVPYLVILVPVLAGLILYGLPAHSRPPSFVLAAAAVGIVLIILVAIAVFVAFLYSAGASVFAISEIYAGRHPSIRGSFRLVRGKGWILLGVMFLSGLIMIAGFIALIIPGIYLMCRIPLATAAAMIDWVERRDPEKFLSHKGLCRTVRADLFVSGIAAVWRRPDVSDAIPRSNRGHCKASSSHTLVDGPRTSRRLAWWPTCCAGPHHRLRIVLL